MQLSKWMARRHLTIGRLRWSTPKRASHLMLLAPLTEIKVRISQTLTGVDRMMKKMSKKGLQNRGQPGNLAISFNAAIATTTKTIKRTNTEYFKWVWFQLAFSDYKGPLYNYTKHHLLIGFNSSCHALTISLCTSLQLHAWYLCNLLLLLYLS